MTKIDTGGPAFPVEAGVIAKGMTLRDYFAAKSMNKMIARAEMHFAERVKEGDTDEWECYHDYVGEQSYLIADAMLKARNK